MWKPWMDAHAARMQAREQKKLEKTEEVSRPVTHGLDKRSQASRKPVLSSDPHPTRMARKDTSGRDRAAEWRERSQEKKESQISGLMAHHREQTEEVTNRLASLPVHEMQVDVPANWPKNKLGRTPGSKNNAVPCPPCPFCHSSRVTRAGFESSRQKKNPQQRFRCGEKDCGRTFYSHVRVVINYKPFHLICYRCGGTGDFCSFRRDKNPAKRTTQSGVMGHCPFCRKLFLQGGPEHLERTMCVLLDRVDKLVPVEKKGSWVDAIRTELLQQASLDVLRGLGYTWNVPLDLSAAKEATREYSKETKKFRREVRGTEDGD